MADLKALKLENSLANVVHESGEALVWDTKAELWRGKQLSDLEINPRTDRYRLGSEVGDVFEWLMRRFGWTFGQAVAYLVNRSKLPTDQRLKLSPDEMLKEPPRSIPSEKPWIEQPKKAQFGVFDDPALRAAFQLGVDYPGGGIQNYFQVHNFITIIREVSWIPTQFIPFIGLLASEECGFCLEELIDSSEIGEMFLAVDPWGSDIKIQNTEGYYCRDCVEKFIRWHKAFMLLADWVRRREEKLAA
jgi:hypothetical protein